VYITLLSAAALLALADRFQHGGSTGSPWLSAIAADQYMFASPIRVNSMSVPSAAKAWARMSQT